MESNGAPRAQEERESRGCGVGGQVKGDEAEDKKELGHGVVFFDACPHLHLVNIPGVQHL